MSEIFDYRGMGFLMFWNDCFFGKNIILFDFKVGYL